MKPAAKVPNLSTQGVARRVLPEEARRSYASEECFQLLPGPQFLNFSREARDAFVATEWAVSSQSDRTGNRLEGGAIAVSDSIRSEPVLAGGLQVPGNGWPIVTMVDGPTVDGPTVGGRLRSEWG